ncbi:MAG: hypothetical protein L6416_10070 [Candidatus Omnitrophica bacterium]|nr:hypothetical protein [Candidatus Omnitrophota bacterium]
MKYFRKSIKMNIFYLLISCFLFFGGPFGCVYRQYSGRSLPHNEFATILIRNDSTIIRTIDGKPTHPSLGKTLLFGGLYGFLFRDTIHTKALVAPGNHILSVDYVTSYARSTRPHSVEFFAEPNHTYGINAVIGDVLPNTFDFDTTSYSWDVFLEDITEPSPVNVGSNIIPSAADIMPSEQRGQ